jgi:hypothetical protein
MRGRTKLNTDPRELAQIGPRQLKDPASVDYAWQTIALLKRKYQSKEVLIQQWEETLAEAEQHRIYEKVPPESPYGSLEAMLKAELGVGVEESRRAKAQQMAADEGVLPLNRNGGDRKTEDGVSGLLDNSEQRGTGTSYLVRRLKRDHPEVAEALGRGEYPSARQAAIAAGIVKVPPPLEVVKKAAARLTPKERREFRRWLDTLD